MTFSAEFRCISGCDGGYALDEIIYRCPKCNDLLEVVHDLAALRTRSAEDWKALFEARWRQVEEPFGSGVWGKHEWVAPHLEPQHIVSMAEGTTHLTRVPRFA
jgi:threonine synthase